MNLIKQKPLIKTVKAGRGDWTRTSSPGFGDLWFAN